MKHKKLISFITAMTMVLSMPFIMVKAAGDTTIKIDSVTTTGGKNVKIPITLSDNPGICGTVISVNYDEGLTLTSIERGDALSTLEMTKPGRFTENPVKLVWDGLEEDKSNGTIAVLTFAAPLIAGDYSISVSYDNGDIVDGNLNSINVRTIQGTITVEETSNSTPKPEPKPNPTISPTEEPTIIPVKNITVELGDEEIYLENNNNTGTIVLIAFYDNENKLIALECHTADNVSIAAEKDENASYSKVMLWDSLKTMKPACEAQTVELSHTYTISEGDEENED